VSNDFYKLSILPYSGIIIKICRAYTNSQEDFEDYFQEVCLQLWRSRNNFKQQSEWSTWVYRVTLNVCLTLQKKHQKNISQFDIKENDLIIKEESVQNKEEIDILYTAIKQLKEIDRAIILLYLEEKSYQDIAQIIGTSTSNIGARINRIKKRLKIILNGTIN